MNILLPYEIKRTFAKIDAVLDICFQTSEEICPTFSISGKPLQIFLVQFLSVLKDFNDRIIFRRCKPDVHDRLRIPNKRYQFILAHVYIPNPKFTGKFWKFPSNVFSTFENSTAFRDEIVGHLTRIDDRRKHITDWLLN